MRERLSYFKAQDGQPVRKSKAVEEVPYLEKAINACIYKEGVLIGQGKFTRHGEIFEDVIIWRPNRDANRT